MRVLVTGGTGFTGTHLSRRLLERGHQVVVLDSQRGLFFDELTERGAEIHLGSVTDAELVRRLTDGCEIVHHVAAMFRKVNLPHSVYWDVNVEGSRNVFEAALEAGVRRVVYCSTCGVHGHVENGPADEDAAVEPEDYYQYTKYQGEVVAEEFLERGLSIVTVRPTAIYGPGDPERFVMLYRRVAKGVFPMFGPGEVHYHPLYIDNLIQAFELAAEADGVDGEAFLIGDENYWTLNELVRAIGDSLDVDVRIVHLPFRPLWVAALLCEMAYKPFRVDPPLFRRRVDWFRQNRAFDIGKAKRLLGYRPQVNLADGLARAGRWYRDEGYL